MSGRIRGLVVAGGIGAACLVAAPAGGIAAETGETAELPVEAIETIVRDYLMREPEIIYEALQELQRRQETAAAERRREAIRANQDALYRDPASPVAGNPDGDVTLVEFFDYRCMYCRRVVSSIQALLDEDDGLRLVLKDLPVLGEDSVRAAQAALASREQDGYVPFHFALMQADDLSEAGILELADEVGLDSVQLAEDMRSPEVRQVIESNYALANQLGIEGTPAFVIGDQLIPGAIDQTQLRRLIEQARAS